MLSKQPGQQLAFLSSADADALAETLVAFANADGGLIVLGVHADGSQAEEIWEEEATGALRVALEQCQPPVMAHWQTLVTKKGELISLRIPRSADLHTLSDGRVLVRHGTSNQPVGGLELIQLANNRTVGDFESTTVAGASLDDFDNDMIEEYLAKRSRRGAAYVGSRRSLLFEIGAIDHESQPTVTGILLFGKFPQMFLPQSGVVFVKFASDKPTGADGKAGYGRRVEMKGPLARVVEQAWNTVWQEMRRSARIRGLEREELLEYPRFAVREALINAICHRDYRERGRRVEVRMYSDRLEVISPGGLAGHMTLDNLVDEHYSRNPRIVNGLFQWGYIEELGLGIDQMIEDMVEAGHPPPRFSATDIFTVTLSNAHPTKPKKTKAPPAARGLNERQLNALRYVKQHGSITNREYQRLCEGYSAESLRRDLAGLVKRGELLKIGSKKGTYYILK